MNSGVSRVLGLLVFVFVATAARAGQTDIAGPADSGGFGTTVTVLPNGNIVVCDPFFDAPGPVADVGAVYLYSPAGVLISTLTGTSPNDHVGSIRDSGSGFDTYASGIVVLANGNYVVRSPEWDNVVVPDAGAVTFCSATTGAGGSAVVSALNSLVGSSPDDKVGVNDNIPAVVPLPNGNYLVVTVFWDNMENGASTNSGAVTWCNGTTGFPSGALATGPVNSTNSLVGTGTSDYVGIGGITILAGGSNYVVSSPAWTNGSTGAFSAGAATWGDGATGITGEVSDTNSLVGTTVNDIVSGAGVTALANGHYVVCSPLWDDGVTTADVGAVTWGDGTAGVNGSVSSTNSLIGVSANDSVGEQGATPLPNGNYVVRSNSWDNPSTSGLNAGAVTWRDGTGAFPDTVTDTNSLVGSTTDDAVGLIPVAVLTNGNYVVPVPAWDNDTVQDAGAATWCPGTQAVFGVISASNSLVGTSANDSVGNFGVTALKNGHYVVSSPFWNNGSTPFVGAVTWGNGATGVKGPVSAVNSLIGSTEFDSVGSGEVTVLANGNYVVRTQTWHNGASANAGAITWANGATGITGIVSPANSLVGGELDTIGISGVYSLTNGNYVVASQTWSGGRGAVTWGNGTTGITGPVTEANSLTGPQFFDNVGSGGVVPLTNGNYVVLSPQWANTGQNATGAVTWGNGATGIKGPVSEANSLIGSGAQDQVGDSGATATSDGNYIVRSPRWSGQTFPNGGAVTLGIGTGGTVGQITSANSVFGLANGFSGAVGNPPTGGFTLVHGYDGNLAQLVVGRPSENIVTRFGYTGSVSFGNPVVGLSEGFGTFPIGIVRTGGASGQVTVNVASTSVGGNATAGSDYVVVPSQQVVFNDGETNKIINVDIIDDAVPDELVESFKLTLSGGNATLGSPSTMMMRIIDNDTDDDTDPGKPVITAPLALARVGVNAGGTITIAGTAVDDRGINAVQVSLNNGPFENAAVIFSGTSPTATWSATVTPVAGANTVRVISFDGAGNDSDTVSRTFIVTRPLVVKTLGGGKVTSGFVPTSFREVGKLITLTATASTKPAPGFLFDKWSVNGGANVLKQIGVSPEALQRTTLTCVFKEGLQLTANFLPNPFTSQVAGTFTGAITASPLLPDRPPGQDDGTPPSLATEGSFRVTVMATGAFSGTLTMDRLVLNFAGVFDANGNARFGTSRTQTLSVARAGKTSLTVALHIDPTPVTASMIGTVTQYGDDPFTALAVSEISADRASYNSSLLVPLDFLGPGNANGIYTLIFASLPPDFQFTEITKEEYPQGHGYARLTLTKTGSVTIAGSLADGTALTTSTTLSIANKCRLFARLYTNQGIVAATLSFAISPDSDVSAPEMRWFRPVLDAQHFPGGWPLGIRTNLVGAKYAVTPDVSVIPGLPAPDGDGNADLTFSDGKLDPLFPPKNVTIDGDDVVTRISDPTSFSLTITRSTARISGTFTHDPDGTKPAFQGMVYQKGLFPGAYGYFLTTTPTVKDYTGQGGAVKLAPQ